MPPDGTNTWMVESVEHFAPATVGAAMAMRVEADTAKFSVSHCPAWRNSTHIEVGVCEEHSSMGCSKSRLMAVHSEGVLNLYHCPPVTANSGIRSREKKHSSAGLQS